MQAKVEVITPETAKLILARNTKNRTLSPATVRRYAGDMKEGRWQGSHQGIALTLQGELLDGQHRLAAIIQAGVPISMLVVRGVDPASFVTMDSGKNRGLSDALSIEGMTYTNTVSGVDRMAWGYAANGNIGSPATTSVLNDFVNKHPYLQTVANQISNRSKHVGKIALGTVVFLANESRGLDNEVEAFIEGVVTGEGLYRGDARLTLREWVTIHKSRGLGEIRNRTMTAAAARAWNAYATGKSLTVIRGIELMNQRQLPLFGFEQGLYFDLPNLQERQQATQFVPGHPVRRPRGESEADATESQ